MAYASSKLVQMVPSLQVGVVPSIWQYTSADSHATIDGAGYISDGYDKGIRAGDIVIAWSTGDANGKIHRCASVQAPADARSPGNTTTLSATLAS